MAAQELPKYNNNTGKFFNIQTMRAQETLQNDSDATSQPNDPKVVRDLKRRVVELRKRLEVVRETMKAREAQQITTPVTDCEGRCPRDRRRLVNVSCSICSTTSTALWRHDDQGNIVCNSCTLKRLLMREMKDQNQ